MCVCFCTKLVAVHCGAAFDIALFIASSPSSAHCCFHSSSVHCHLLLLLSSLQCLEDNVITEERFDRWKSLVRLLAPRFASDRRSRFLLWLCLSLCSLTVTEGRGGGRGGGLVAKSCHCLLFHLVCAPPACSCGCCCAEQFLETFKNEHQCSLAGDYDQTPLDFVADTFKVRAIHVLHFLSSNKEEVERSRGRVCVCMCVYVCV